MLLNQGIEMSYLKEFQTQIANHNLTSILKLWEEYCSGDELDCDELIQILKALKYSDMAENFGRHVDRILPLWTALGDTPVAYEILSLIIDIQTENNEMFADYAYNALHKKFGNDPNFNERIRLVGLRSRDKFQGAIGNYELLAHMQKGNYVFHIGGWGVGEIVDVSPIREQVSVEFDYVPGRKDLSFSNAFKTLLPIPEDHFLAMRFGTPDVLEQKAKENPAEMIRILLRDLGPKTASEIKDELCELVIPASEWQKWWQSARAKVKKDTMIQSPVDIKDPFILLRQEMRHEDKLQKALEGKPDANTLIQMVYSFFKDFSDTLKDPTFKALLQDKLKEALSYQEISDAQELQIHFFLEDLSNESEYAPILELIRRFKDLESIIDNIEILAFKKRLLTEIRKHKSDWQEFFLSIFFKMDQGTLRDYILNELIAAGQTDQIKAKLETLLAQPGQNPEAYIWYFQKVMSQDSLPFADQAGRIRFFEGFLILLSRVEENPDQRDLVKKIHAILSAGRYAIVRQIMQKASIQEVQEFLLLATKCHSLSDHDIKILHSLGEVVHPSLAKLQKNKHKDSLETEVIWTTKEGFQKLQDRIQQIGTVETVENAKEIEIARSHGDLRENAEFKSALEKRDRLQGELKFLSDQLNKCRILSKEDIPSDEVGVGSIVECKNQKGQKVTYTLLGPWDADTEKNILSFQSKLAQTMKGKAVGEKFQFQGEEYTIASIKSFL